jgi:cobalt-precorrin 5A hydrolase
MRGANALTRYLAGMLGADPVITTATDVNELAALDTLAFQLNARMTDFRAAVKTVNQMLVSGKRVGLWCDANYRGAKPLRPARLYSGDRSARACRARRADLRHPAPVAAAAAVPHWKLVPQRVVAGIGCRRDTPSLLSALLERQLAAQRLDPLALKAIGSVSLKANEGCASWLIAAGCRSKPSALRRCASMSTAFRPRLLSGRRSASAASPARWPGC